MPTAGRQASAIGGCSWSSGGWPEHELAARLGDATCRKASTDGNDRANATPLHGSSGGRRPAAIGLDDGQRANRAVAAVRVADEAPIFEQRERTKHGRDGQSGHGDELVDGGPAGDQLAADAACGPAQLDERGLGVGARRNRRWSVVVDQPEVVEQLRDAGNDPRGALVLAKERQAPGGRPAPRSRPERGRRRGPPRAPTRR